MLDTNAKFEPRYFSGADEQRMQHFISIAAAGEVPTQRQFEKFRDKRMESAKQAAAKAVRAVKGRIGVIPIHGPISKNFDMMMMMMGGTGCDEISMQLDYLLADASVEAIVLHVDSPGGGTYGIEELSDKIFAARAKKPCYAMVDPMACSAAYWLATAAQTVCCTPSGDVGSVGVYRIHIDQSEMLAKLGVKPTVIRAGKFKLKPNMIDPLDDDDLEYLQADVDDMESKFIAALARNRHDVSKADVRANFGQGRVISAAKALSVGMIDQICTYENLIQRLTGSAGIGSAARASALEMKRMQQAHRERQMELTQ